MTSLTVDTASIAQAFSKPIAPVRASLGYRLALALVTVAMVLLPCVYLALIAGAARLVVWWADAGRSLFHGGVHGLHVGLLLLVAYAGPLVIGAILVLFMIKPLFARRGGQGRSTSVDRRTQPLLLAYIAALCRTMRAPVPTRVDVDVRVNASASFRNGLWSMLGNDLVLTIGLPLVATMTVRQLTAVLAHEFGHFSQGAGMRFSYLTVVINHWFARVVYERDAWDEQLAEWSREADFRIAIVLLLARGGVALSRGVLWVLMQVGHLLSMLLSRQMEFDADQHAVRVAGHGPFIETMRLLPILDLAQRGAHSDLGQAWAEGRLGDDLPALVHANLAQVPDALRKEAIAQAMTGQPGMYASHPATGLRIARAEGTPGPGVLALDGPATALFSDFPGLCRAASLDHYRELLGEGLDTRKLQSTAALVADIKRVEAQHQAGKRVWGELWGWARLFDPRGQTADSGSADPRARLLAAGAAFAAARDAATVPAQALLDAARDQTKLRTACELSAAGRTVPLHELGLRSQHELLPAVARINRTVEERAAALVPLDGAVRERIAALQALLELPDHGLRGIDAAHLAAVREALVGLCGRRDDINALRLAFEELGALCRHLGEHQEDQRYVGTVLSRLEEVNKGINAVRRLSAPYPFAHEKAGTSIGAFLVPDLPGRQDLGASMGAAEGALQRCFSLHNRCLGALAEAVEVAEAALTPVKAPALARAPAPSTGEPRTQRTARQQPTRS